MALTRGNGRAESFGGFEATASGRDETPPFIRWIKEWLPVLVIVGTVVGGGVSLWYSLRSAIDEKASAADVDRAVDESLLDHSVTIHPRTESRLRELEVERKESRDRLKRIETTQEVMVETLKDIKRDVRRGGR